MQENNRDIGKLALAIFKEELHRNIFGEVKNFDMCDTYYTFCTNISEGGFCYFTDERNICELFKYGQFNNDTLPCVTCITFTSLNVSDDNDVRENLFEIKGTNLWASRQINIVRELTILEVLKNFPTLIQCYSKQHLDMITESDYKEAVIHNPSLLRYVPDKYLTHELCWTIIKMNPYSMYYIRNDLITYDMCHYAINKYPLSLRFIPNHIINYDLVKQTIINDGKTLVHVPPHMMTQELCDISFCHDIRNIKIIPRKYRNIRMFIDIINDFIKNDTKILENGGYIINYDFADLLRCIPFEEENVCIELLNNNVMFFNLIPVVYRTINVCVKYIENEITQK